RTQLQRLADTYPEDQNLARAVAEVLTYEPATRRDGIDRLTAMVDAQPQLRTPLRQALLWLQAQPGDRSRYEEYLRRWPDDAMVRAQLELGVVTSRRQDGFAALNAGRPGDAEQAFKDALRADANDVDAQAGLGLVALQRQNF